MQYNNNQMVYADAAVAIADGHDIGRYFSLVAFKIFFFFKKYIKQHERETETNEFKCVQNRLWYRLWKKV